MAPHSWLQLAASRHQTVRAVLLICHGMSEHAARYQPLALQLAQHGIAVYAHDHRGHGPHAAHHGWFAAADGWNKVVAM
jgi:alpha-beta hydrolase superfamily lysophospholipase